MKDSFYKILEDKHRGNRALIKNRLKVYLDFIIPLKTIMNHPKALDLGCGRGEWLEILKENGFKYTGIDLETSMINFCKEKNLNVKQIDAIRYLKSVPKKSLDLITGFHIAEHLDFDALQELISLSFKALKKGGLLILETPNPENIAVSTKLFYMDPTHNHPLPPELLKLAVEYHGFERVKIVRLQETQNILQKENLTLMDVFDGVSPDYSIVAQKSASKEIIDNFQTCFEKNYGVNLENIVNHYDNQIRTNFEKTDALIEELRKEKEQERKEKERIAQEKEQLQHEIYNLTNSNSWKITRPLRVLRRYLKDIDVKYLLKNLVIHAESIINRFPKLKFLIKKILLKFPYLHMKLTKLKNINNTAATLQTNENNHTNSTLSLREERFYDILQYRQKIQKPDQTTDENLLAYISPLPPQHSGISFYSSDLLEGLKEYFKIELIVLNKEEIDQEKFSNFTIRTVDYFVQNSAKYSKVLYHFGNSSFHSHMFDLLRLIPGVIVLHDFYLSHMLYDVAMQKEGLNTFSQILYKSHGYKALQKLSQRTTEEVIWQYPANLEILQNAVGIIVHSDYSIALADKYYFTCNHEKWHKIPLLRKDPIIKEKRPTKKKLSIAEDTFVICSFGYIGPTKLTLKLLESLKNLSLQGDYLLVLAGKISDAQYDLTLKKFIKENALQERVRITGWISDEEYRDYLNAADIAVQLRADSRGETSASVLDCMNYALPLILNAHGAMKDIPEEAVLMLEEEFQTAQLAQAIEFLYHNKQKRDNLAQNAKNIILQKHTLSACASLYREALKTSYENNIFPTPKISNELDVISAAKALSKIESQSRQIRQKQIFVDISSIVREDLKTGIQRVVRSQLKNLIDVVPDTYRVEGVYLTTLNNEWTYCYAYVYMNEFLELKNFKLQERPVDVYKGDIFYGLDLAGSMVSLAAKAGIYEKYKAQGVKILFAVYDLLPIEHPEFFPIESKSVHEQWLSSIVNSADKLICISKSVADEVKSWIKQHRQENQQLPEVTFLHLGADIKSSHIPITSPSVKNSVLSKLQKGVTFLMVGTIEPRKGHAQVLKAFESLWEQGYNVNLIIVGKKGWMVDELADKLMNHTKSNTKLLWLQKADDTLLQQAYDFSDCVIVASEAEGFGLPLIEAAHHKLPLVVRDIPVFKEVAAEHALYFKNLRDPHAIVEILKQWLKMYENNTHPISENMSYMTWNENAKQLFKILVQ